MVTKGEENKWQVAKSHGKFIEAMRKIDELKEDMNQKFTAILLNMLLISGK